MNTPTQDTNAPAPAVQINKEKLTRYTHKLAGPAISLISYGLIAGFALSGLGLMALGTLTWIIFGEQLFGCAGLLIGGMFVITATALCLGRLAKAGDNFYQNSRKAQTA